MTLEGVRITLPDGTTFFGRGDLTVQVRHKSNFLLEGGSSVIGAAGNLFDDVGGQGSSTIKTPLASGHIGAAGGFRRITVDFSQWAGSTDAWGPASSGDSVQTKMSVLDAELARSNPSSLDPATLEYGEFHGSGMYDPVPVVFEEVNPVVDHGETSSSFRPSVTCEETIDLSGTVDDQSTTQGDYRLTPANSLTPRVPIPADTLGPGGRGSGRLVQGNQAAPSSLVDTNGTASSPTTQATSISPSEVRLRGAWRGDAAAAIADDFRTDFLRNETRDEVALTAPGRSGADPITGTYVLTDESSIDPLTPQVQGGVYGFELVLREVDT